MNQETLRLEDELEWWTRLQDSDGWRLFKAHWQPMCEQTATQLRASDTPNRDWVAGLVTGYERLLRYPETRTKQIQKELAKRANKQP